MSPKNLTRIFCPLCQWQSPATNVKEDDGSIMTDFRRHFDRDHRLDPYREDWTEE